MAMTVSIREKQFKRRFRGYDQAEVSQYLGEIAQRMEEMEQENDELRRRIKIQQDILGKIKLGSLAGG